MPKTILAFAPHPDDLEFSAGGTIAAMVQEGAAVHLVIATDGCRGSFEHPSRKLAELRLQEAQRAAAVLGIQPPILLGYPDLELDTLPPGKLREQFIRYIREFRPEIVFAEDAFAAYETHPDHRAVAWAAAEALSFATLPLVYPEHREAGLEPHFVPEKYFYSDVGTGSNKVTDISQTIDRKLAALAEHKTQVDFLVEDVLRQARIAGLDVGAVLGEAEGNPMEALSWAIRLQAAETGAPAGHTYAEAFRYVRFHPFVESILAGQS
jgi:LmbE family N-acetylglucosaminyl deacetylase